MKATFGGSFQFEGDWNLHIFVSAQIGSISSRNVALRLWFESRGAAQ